MQKAAASSAASGSVYDGSVLAAISTDSDREEEEDEDEEDEEQEAHWPTVQSSRH